MLVHQLLTAVNALGAAEGLALAEALGIEDTPALLALLQRSWGHSTMLARSGGLVLVAAEANGGGGEAELEAPSAAPLRNFAKDLDFALRAAEGAGLALPAAIATRDAVAARPPPTMQW